MTGSSAKVTLSGRVKEAAAKGLLGKQLGGLNTDVAFFNTSTGVIKSKRAKKEKSPEDECLADMKKLHKKFFDVHQYVMFFMVQGKWDRFTILKGLFPSKHWPPILGGSRCGMTSQFVQPNSLHTTCEILLSWWLSCTVFV